MAYLASNILPESGYRRSKQIALQVKGYCQNRSAQFSNDTNADVILGTFQDLKSYRDELNAIKTIPGIAQYAKDQENNQLYDVAAEFNALIASIEAVMTNIFNTFPKDASSYLLEKKLLVNGTYEFRVIAAASLVTLKGLLDTVVTGVT